MFLVDSSAWIEYLRPITTQDSNIPTFQHSNIPAIQVVYEPFQAT